MNPILRMLMMSTWSKGVGDRFDGSQTSDFKNLTDELARAKAAKAASDPFAQAAGPNSAYSAFKASAGPDDAKQPQQSPIDRIKQAFDALKDMHKAPDQTPSNSPSPFDTAQWPYGPVGAPQASAVPMPQPRPLQAPQPEAPQPQADSANPLMSLFQRSTAMQRDPLTGDFIDPKAGATAAAQPGILSSLFA
jgi:hypothetical protein